MALVFNDRVKETATVSGTGNATLAGADTGFFTAQLPTSGNSSAKLEASNHVNHST